MGEVVWQQSTHLNFDDRFIHTRLKQNVGRIIHLCGFVKALQQSTRLGELIYYGQDGVAAKHAIEF